MKRPIVCYLLTVITRNVKHSMAVVDTEDRLLMMLRKQRKFKNKAEFIKAVEKELDLKIDKVIFEPIVFTAGEARNLIGGLRRKEHKMPDYMLRYDRLFGQYSNPKKGHIRYKKMK